MRPSRCGECGSFAVADLDAAHGLWVCDDCGEVTEVYDGETVPPFTRPGAETVELDGDYL